MHRASFANRTIRLAAVGCLCALLAGCASAATPGGQAGGMGMSGSGDNLMLGVVASSADASIQVGASALGAQGLVISRVVAPDDGWVVVHSTVAPAGVVGKAAVQRGENTDVRVPLTAPDGTWVTVSLHVDRGAKGVLELDLERPERSLDRQVFSDGLPLAALVELSDYGVDVLPNSALVKVEDQPAGGRTLRVDYLLVPKAAWIVVETVEDGVPARRLGSLSAYTGEWQGLEVPLEQDLVPGTLVVTVYGDRGTPGKLDVAAGDPLSASDRPFVSAGVAVSQRVKVR